MNRWVERTAWLIVGAVVGWSLLSIPEPSPPRLELPPGRPFIWDRDAFFRSLEDEFVGAREAGCVDEWSLQAEEIRERFGELRDVRESPTSLEWDQWEKDWMTLVAGAGGCPRFVTTIAALRSEIRAAIPELSGHWRQHTGARDRIYRLSYGTRLAVEELMLQMPRGSVPSLSLEEEVPSAAPSKMVRGVRIHSGDLLVSRGGAPTSAFIARGSDYPGNFSHVAVAHVDEHTQRVSLVEAHIESGVGVSSVEDYLADKKLRILLLRLADDHPVLEEDPLAMHRAATFALQSATEGHIPYDFSMDVSDATKQFCSEVASAAYAEVGVRLWQSESRFSAPGLARWMSSLGVRHLSTHGPSDLEYDPALRVVAEWHDPHELWFDHVDGAVIDAMLERAEGGAEFEFSRPLLPVVRMLKGYSMILNAFGKVGPIPEGMSATVALRAAWLNETHARIRDRVLEKSETFETSHGYPPPYFRLTELAREAMDE